MKTPKDAQERSLSRDLNCPWRPVTEELALLSCLLQPRFFPPDKACPAPGGPRPPPLFAEPMQTLEGHRTSTFPPKHTRTFNPGGNRTMVQQKERRKAVPGPGQEARTHPSTVTPFPFQLLLQGGPQGAGDKHPLGSAPTSQRIC